MTYLRRNVPTAFSVKYQCPKRRFMSGFASTRSTTLASSPMPAANVKARPLTRPRSTARGSQRSGSAEQVLGGVHDVVGDPEHLAEDVVGAAGQAGQRRPRAGQAVGGLVDRAVAAERDDHVVALARGLADELDRVALALGVDRGDVVAALQRVDDEVLEPVRHRRRVRVDDDQHALGLGRALERGDVCEPLEGRRSGDGHRVLNTRAAAAVTLGPCRSGRCERGRADAPRAAAAGAARRPGRVQLAPRARGGVRARDVGAARPHRRAWPRRTASWLGMAGTFADERPARDREPLGRVGRPAGPRRAGSGRALVEAADRAGARAPGSGGSS